MFTLMCSLEYILLANNNPAAYVSGRGTCLGACVIFRESYCIAMYNYGLNIDVLTSNILNLN